MNEERNRSLLEVARSADDCEAHIVADIVADISDRRGLRQEWSDIDDDVDFEIIRAWELIVHDRMVAFRKESK